VLFAVGYSDLPFVLPLGRIAAVAAVTAAVALLSCFVAAWPAARVHVDTALADLG
jgi:ABC-type lipoprotein release transport system permease subunit